MLSNALLAQEQVDCAFGPGEGVRVWMGLCEPVLLLRTLFGMITLRCACCFFFLSIPLS